MAPVSWKPSFALSAATVALCVSHWAHAAPSSELKATTCRYLPGDTAWPNDADWSSFNATTGGKLIRGVPLATPCYGSNYNPDTCAQIQAAWVTTKLHYEDPTSIMAPYWQNDSCSPFLGELAKVNVTSAGDHAVTNGTCTSGNIAIYAVEIDSARTAAAAFEFASKKNIRLSIKNTGHDYIGRSNGRGSLALWTHKLDALSFIDYESTFYSGPAAKAGAGVQVVDAYRQGAANGYRITGGYCPSVGLVGGYVQGGGHGPLGASYGLAADNVLEYEVVTTDGRHLVASRTQNADLYWALSGGGAGNYGLVLSLTIKAHPDGPVGGASIYFPNTDSDTYWEAIVEFQTRLLGWNQLPNLALSFGFDNTGFQLNMATWPGATQAKVNETFTPYLEKLEDLNITAEFRSDVQPSFFDHYEQYSFPDAVYQTNSTLGGWLISPDAVKNNLTYIIDSYKKIVTDPTAALTRVSAISGNLSYDHVGIQPGTNSVLEAWRNSLYTVNVAEGYAPDVSPEQLKLIQAKVNTWQDFFKPLGGGAYLNEATWDDKDWKQDYFGVNYDKLLSIKRKYDRDFALWQHTSVGADVYWTPNDEGKLCRVKAGQ